MASLGVIQMLQLIHVKFCTIKRSIGCCDWSQSQNYCCIIAGRNFIQDGLNTSVT